MRGDGRGPGHRIQLQELRNRIAGGWAGQMIGVIYAAPTEFRSRGAINESELPPWTPERVVLGEPYPGSAGSAVVIDDLVVFR